MRTILWRGSIDEKDARESNRELRGIPPRNFATVCAEFWKKFIAQSVSAHSNCKPTIPREDVIRMLSGNPEDQS
jgi:hypothetical protein